MEDFTYSQLNVNRYFSKILFLCFAALPLLGLLWQMQIGPVQGNWLVYPLVVVAIFLTLTSRTSVPILVLPAGILFILYGIIFYLNDEHPESLIRFFFTLLPIFFFLRVRDSQSNRTQFAFVALYFLSISVPILFSYQQWIGARPYTEFDMVNGVYTGRLSGGYSKPNNLVAVLVPVFIFGLYQFVVQKRWFIGGMLMFVVYVAIYLIGLRIATIALTLIVALSVRPRLLNFVVKTYYKYFMNLVVGVLFILGFSWFYQEYGLVEGIRGRIPMWQAHAYEFVHNSDVNDWLLGKSHVEIPRDYLESRLIDSLKEAHNNSLRIVVTFGVLGFVFYCVTFRWLVLSVYSLAKDSNQKVVYSAGFLFYIVYSVTNEPIFYSSVTWLILLPVFINFSSTNGRTTEHPANIS